MKSRLILLPFLAAGLVFAQSAQPAPHARKAGSGMVHRLSMRLNLTAGQQKQARAIFKQARADSQAFRPKIQAERAALKNAVKSDNEGQIDQVLTQNSQINAQARAIHTKAMARFYQILTPDQKAKFDQMGPRRRAANAETR